MGDLQISLLRSYRDAITELEKTVCEVGIFLSVFQVCWVQEFYFGQVLIEIRVRYPSGSVEAEVRSSVETLG